MAEAGAWTHTRGASSRRARGSAARPTARSPLLARLQSPTVHTSIAHSLTTSARVKEVDRLRSNRERKQERERKNREFAQDKAAKRHAQLWAALERKSVVRLQAAWRGRKGRRVADEQDCARPGLRLAVREQERERIAELRVQHQADAKARAEAERRQRHKARLQRSATDSLALRRAAAEQARQAAMAEALARQQQEQRQPGGKARRRQLEGEYYAAWAAGAYGDELAALAAEQAELAERRRLAAEAARPPAPRLLSLRATLNTAHDGHVFLGLVMLRATVGVTARAEADGRVSVALSTCTTPVRRGLARARTTICAGGAADETHAPPPADPSWNAARGWVGQRARNASLR